MTTPHTQSHRSPTHALIRPHITERATALAEQNAYVFVVEPKATKREVIAAVKALYNVVPHKVNTVSIPAKRRTGRRGIHGVHSGYKKAIVYLKAGETISFT